MDKGTAPRRRERTRQIIPGGGDFVSFFGPGDGVLRTSSSSSSILFHLNLRSQLQIDIKSINLQTKIDTAICKV